MKTKILSVATALVLGAASFSASAGTASSPFQATASVVGECAILPSEVDLGQVGVLNTQKIRVAGNIQIECTGAVPYQLMSTGSTSLRSMQRVGDAASAGHIVFRTYTDSAYTTTYHSNSTQHTSAGGVENVPVYVEASNAYAGTKIPAVGQWLGSQPFTITF